jgi:hypothetical protein
VTAAGFRVGDRVRIERDETRWPPRGSWHRYRGKTGTVVQINQSAGEYGVVFGSERRASALTPSGKPQGHHGVSWFLPHEIVAAGTQTRSGPSPSETAKARKAAKSEGAGDAVAS